MDSEHETRAGIMDQIKSLYGPRYPDCTFGLIFTNFLSHCYYDPVLGDEESDEENPEWVYKAHAIVYTKPNSFAEWELLLQGGPCISKGGAADLLCRKTEGFLHGATGEMQEGWTYDKGGPKKPKP